MTRPTKKFHGYYIFLVVLMICYGAIALLIPPDQAAVDRYGLTMTQARLLKTTISLPAIAVWTVAFIGSARLKRYAGMTDNHQDGQAFNTLSNGLLMIAVSMPLSETLSNLGDYYARSNQSMSRLFTIYNNYLLVILTLGAAWLISQGAKQLVKSLKRRPPTMNQAILGAAFAAFCFIFTYVALTDTARSINGGSGNQVSYYLPDYLLFATIIVPYILVWYLGLRSVYHIRQYSSHAPGSLYKVPINRVANGLLVVIISTMILRIIASMNSFITSLSLGAVLALLYFLIIWIGFGYWLIASGAKRLRRIEEV